jgi:hypothetical protein
MLLRIFCTSILAIGSLVVASGCDMRPKIVMYKGIAPPPPKLAGSGGGGPVNVGEGELGEKPVPLNEVPAEPEDKQ